QSVVKQINMRVAMSLITASASQLIAARVPLRPDRPASRSVKEQFFGTWKLVSWKIKWANSDLTDSPLGPNAWAHHVRSGRTSERCVHASRSSELCLQPSDGGHTGGNQERL